MLKGLNDFLDKHEGRKVGSSTKAILKERKAQGYDRGAKSKALEGMKEGVGKGTGTPKAKWGTKQGNWHKVMPGDR